MSFQQHGSMRVVNCCLFGSKKAMLGILLGFCLITTLESYAMSHFSGENPGKPQIRNNGATITDHQPKMLCAPNKMIEADEDGGKGRSTRVAQCTFVNSVSIACFFFSSFSLINLFLFCFLLFSLFHKCKHTNSDSE